MIGRGWPHPFALVRDHDVTGVSGTGTVATGVAWPDGRAAMLWDTGRPPAGHDTPVRQVMLWDSVDEIEPVCGHSGATRLVWRDPAGPVTDLGLAVFGIVGWYGPTARVTHWGVRWDHGPAVTWRAAAQRPARIEQWPDGAHAAFAELSDLDADEVFIAWVPHDALTIATATRSVEGRRWQHPRTVAPRRARAK